MASLPTYAVMMDPADCKWFRKHQGTHRCFAAELDTGTERLSIWIGYRGRYSRKFRKASYDIWFQEGHLLGGQKRLHLNAAYRDPSLLRGRLAFELFADIGVPTPRAWHVWLTLNGQPLGVYTALESVDETWVTRQGWDPTTIYYGVGHGATFGILDLDTGKPKDDLTVGYEKCYPADEEFHDLEELILGVALPPNETFATSIGEILDVDEYLRWLAGVVFTSHTDGIVQNFALFRAPAGLWQISPWDCDGTFGRVPGGGRIPADDMGLLAAPDNHLVARLITTPVWRQRYLDLFERLLAGPFSWKRISLRLERLFSEIKTDVLRDPIVGGRSDEFLKEPELIRRYVTQRAELLQRDVEAWRIPRNLPWHPRQRARAAKR